MRCFMNTTGDRKHQLFVEKAGEGVTPSGDEYLPRMYFLNPLVLPWFYQKKGPISGAFNKLDSFNVNH